MGRCHTIFVGSRGDRGCTLDSHSVLFYSFIIILFSCFMFHVINWLAGRGVHVYFSRGSRLKSIVSYWGDKKGLATEGL